MHPKYVYFCFVHKSCPTSLLTGEHVRMVVRCGECQKPQCLYAKNELTTRQMNSVKRIIHSYDYVCGSVGTQKVNIFLWRV